MITAKKSGKKQDSVEKVKTDNNDNTSKSHPRLYYRGTFIIVSLAVLVFGLVLAMNARHTLAEFDISPSTKTTKKQISTGMVGEAPVHTNSMEDEQVSEDSNSNVEEVLERKCADNYNIIMLSQSPFVAFVQDFLQPGEAESIRQLTAGRMKRSPVVVQANQANVSEDRTSFSTFLSESETPEVICIEKRAAKLQCLENVNNLEGLQTVWYREGQQYKPHWDYFQPQYLDTLKDGGQRVSTILVYLNSHGEQLQGGDTVFPNLAPVPHLCGTILTCIYENGTDVSGGLRVKPIKNSAVWWFNTEASAPVHTAELPLQLDSPPDEPRKTLSFKLGDERTLHGGMPVSSGEKFAINIWTRERAFRWQGLPVSYDINA